MRKFLLISSLLLVASSCIKRNSIGPVPEISFLEFNQKTTTQYDSATIKLGYKDSDGDLFLDASSDGPNLILKTYEAPLDSPTLRTGLLIPKNIVQPADGFYKGKSIEGYIYLNESEFRKFPKTTRQIRFEVFVVDTDGNKSNVAVSETYTLSN